MAVQTADALEQQVDRGQVGDHDVHVDVEGLLDDLGADDDEAVRPLATGRVQDPVGTQALSQLALAACPVGGDEAGVDEEHLAPDLPGEPLRQEVVGVLGAGDGVVDHRGAATVDERDAQQVDQRLVVVVEAVQLDGPPPRRFHGHHLDLGARRRPGGHRRVAVRSRENGAGIGLTVVVTGRTAGVRLDQRAALTISQGGR